MKAANRLNSFPGIKQVSAECMQVIDEYRLLVDEYRVSVFAPEIGTKVPVSEKRLQKKWLDVENICLRVE